MMGSFGIEQCVVGIEDSRLCERVESAIHILREGIVNTHRIQLEDK